MKMFSTIKRVYSTILRESPLYIVLSLCSVVFKTVRPFVYIFFVRTLTDEFLAQQGYARLAALCVGFLCCYNILQIVDYKLEQLMAVFGNEINNQFESNINFCISHLDYEYLENPETLDKRDRALEGIKENNGTKLSDVNLQIVTILSSGLIVVGTFYLTCSLSPLIIVFLLLTILGTLYFENKMALIELESWKKWVPLNRRFRMVYNLMYDFKHAQDVRLYNTYDFFSGQANQYNADSNTVLKDESTLTAHYMIRENLINVIQFVGVQFAVIYLAIQGIITVGEYTMYINSANSFAQNSMTVIRELVLVRKSLLYLNEYFEFLDIPNIKATKGADVPAGAHCIEFRDVSFRYPKGSYNILEHVNVKITPNEKIGIVGKNGAGKTTFIKLLLRFFEPTEGVILLDGVDIRNYEYEKYLEQFSAVFQDFNIYPLTVRENIVCQEQAEDSMIFSVLDELHMTEKIKKLPNGLNTVASKAMDATGADFSTGEKQMLAMARAIYKNSSILILDEPTASLDAKSEYLLYEKYKEISHEKTSFFVSHRLASCMFCDSILVFDQGTIIQHGTHEELMKDVNGLYARMFTLQAEHYKL